MVCQGVKRAGVGVAEVRRLARGCLTFQMTCKTEVVNELVVSESKRSTGLAVFTSRNV